MAQMNDAAETAPGRVLRAGLLPAFDRGGGASTVPLVGAGVGAGFLNGMTVIGPGSAIPLHLHNCEESVVILEGRATAEIDGVRNDDLRPFDATWIPAGVPHRFINAAEGVPLRILWFYARLDATRTLVETGETRPVAAEHARPPMAAQERP